MSEYGEFHYKDFRFIVTKGLIELLGALAKIDRPEVWSKLNDITSECFKRMNKRRAEGQTGQFFSNLTATFPETTIRLKVKVWGNHYPDSKNHNTGRVEIFLSPMGKEEFTGQQVDDFLVEQILLGND